MSPAEVEAGFVLRLQSLIQPCRAMLRAWPLDNDIMVVSFSHMLEMSPGHRDERCFRVDLMTSAATLAAIDTLAVAL